MTMQIKYYIGGEEIKTEDAMMMLNNKMAFVIEETKFNNAINVALRPLVH